MASTKRMNQIAAIVQREISVVLQREGSYIYGNAFVTVTQVNMTSDLGIARIYLSVYNVENKQSVIDVVQLNVQRLRNELAYRVKRHMRRVPVLEFYEDDTLDEMYRLRGIFDKMQEGTEKTKESNVDKKEEGE